MQIAKSLSNSLKLSSAVRLIHFVFKKWTNGFEQKSKELMKEGNIKKFSCIKPYFSLGSKYLDSLPPAGVRCFFMDESFKAINLDIISTTGITFITPDYQVWNSLFRLVEQLWRSVSAKLEIPDAIAECFFIWAVGDSVGTGSASHHLRYTYFSFAKELLLYNDTTLNSVIENWPPNVMKWVDASAHLDRWTHIMFFFFFHF